MSDEEQWKTVKNSNLVVTLFFGPSYSLIKEGSKFNRIHDPPQPYPHPNPMFDLLYNLQFKITPTLAVVIFFDCNVSIEFNYIG